MDCFQAGKLEADADRTRPRLKANERDVKVSGAIAQSIVLCIESDQRHDEDVGPHGNARTRNRNAVYARIHLVTGCPAVKVQRLTRPDHKRQCSYPPFSLKAFE